MTIKEVKRYKKDIEILKRENPNKMKEKIKEMLNKILKENGKESFEQEVETMFDNLLYYYLHKGERMPNQCYDLAIQFAEILIEKDNLQRAEEVVLSAANITTKREDTENEVTQTDTPEFIKLRDEILKINELKSKKLGKRDLESYTIFAQMAKKHDIEQIKGEILPKKEGETENTPNPNPNPNPPALGKKGKIQDYLSPHHRLDFIEKSFPGKKLKIYGGMAKFEEFLIIEIEGMDSVIVENFFTTTKTGEKVVTQGTDATFIVPKEYVLQLQNLSKSGLMELSKDDSRIRCAKHRKGTDGPILKNNGELEYDNIKYYTRVKKKFNTSIGYEFFEGFGFDEKTTRRKSKVPATKEDEQNTKGKTKIQPTLTRNELEQKLAIKLQEIQNYTSELREAIAKKQEITKISESLRQTVEELEKIQKQIGEIRED